MGTAAPSPIAIRARNSRLPSRPVTEDATRSIGPQSGRGGVRGHAQQDAAMDRRVADDAAARDVGPARLELGLHERNHHA